MTIKVCIGNYGYRNEGELRDKWIELPKTSQEISDFLTDNGLMDPSHEETYISDWDGMPLDAPELLNEHTHLDELNLLAHMMDERPDAFEKVSSALGCGIDGPDSLVGLMNWIEQADEVPFYPYDYEHMGAVDGFGEKTVDRLSAEQNMGYTALESWYPDLLAALEKTGCAMSAFDVGRFGEAIAESCGFALGRDGYVDQNEDMPREDMYTLPELLQDYPDIDEDSDKVDLLDGYDDPALVETRQMPASREVEAR